MLPEQKKTGALFSLVQCQRAKHLWNQYGIASCIERYYDLEYSSERLPCLHARLPARLLVEAGFPSDEETYVLCKIKQVDNKGEKEQQSAIEGKKEELKRGGSGVVLALILERKEAKGRDFDHYFTSDRNNQEATEEEIIGLFAIQPVLRQNSKEAIGTLLNTNAVTLWSNNGKKTEAEEYLAQKLQVEHVKVIKSVEEFAKHDVTERKVLRIVPSSIAFNYLDEEDLVVAVGLPSALSWLNRKVTKATIT